MNLKKTLVILTALFAAFSVQAEIQEGKEYITINQPHSAQPEVIEFFSFACPHCYNFEKEFHIPEQIKAQMPKGTQFKQYHVNWQGEELVRAWALAMALGIEDKIRMPMFEAVQGRKVNDMNDIRNVFLANGVTAEQFDGSINSFAVNALVNQQIQLAEKLNVRATPDFYINEKYHVNMEGMPHDDSFDKVYVQTVLDLLKK